MYWRRSVESLEIHVFDYALSPTYKPPRISAQTLYWQKLESFFLADSIDQSSFKFSQWALKDARFMKQSAYWPFKVNDFGTNWKRVGLSDFLFDLNSNLRPILPRFRDIRAFVRRKPLFQHPTPIRAKISGCFPRSRPVMFGLQRANIPG